MALMMLMVKMMMRIFVSRNEQSKQAWRQADEDVADMQSVVELLEVEDKNEDVAEMKNVDEAADLVTMDDAHSQKEQGSPLMEMMTMHDEVGNAEEDLIKE
jgi:hypothetical protein